MICARPVSHTLRLPRLPSFSTTFQLPYLSCLTSRVPSFDSLRVPTGAITGQSCSHSRCYTSTPIRHPLSPYVTPAQLDVKRSALDLLRHFITVGRRSDVSDRCGPNKTSIVTTCDRCFLPSVKQQLLPPSRPVHNCWMLPPYHRLSGRTARPRETPCPGRDTRSGGDGSAVVVQ